MYDLKSLSPIELLRLYGKIINELKVRGIAKTRNQPISEYAKWLIVNKLELKDEKNSNAKFDGIDTDGNKYLVRSRQIIGGKIIKFSVIRNLENKNFDYLILITFDQNFDVTEAYKVPIEFIIKDVEYNEYQNGYLIDLKKINLKDSKIEDIKSLL